MSDVLPSITVVTPSFNQAHFLERTIQSVLSQDYPRLEYLVMDGGSTDGSVEIIKRYADRIDYWQSKPDGGQTAAVNAGWRRGHGEVLCFLNSDDYYLPGALRYVGEFMQAHPEIWVAYGSGDAVDEEGRHLYYTGWPFSRRMMILSQNCVPQASSFVRRDAIEAVGYMNESLHYTMDLELFLRIADHQLPRFLSRTLSGATVHRDAKTVRDRDHMARERYLVRRRFARPAELPLVLLQPLASRLYHAMPSSVRRAVNRLRPGRTRRPLGI